MKLNEEKYRKSNVPVNEKSGKQDITVWFDVMDIAEVNEPEASESLIHNFVKS